MFFNWLSTLTLFTTVLCAIGIEVEPTGLAQNWPLGIEVEPTGLVQKQAIGIEVEPHG